MSIKKYKSLKFEEALEELETLVNTLEKGELSLEDSLKSFERGVTLTRVCQHALKEAEQAVQILTENNDELSLDEYKEP